jgi:alkylated DNA repair dioxygenase AlkB
MYGKTITAPRSFVWMGSVPAKMYGKEVPITPWTTDTQELLDIVNKTTGVEFNSLNINMYKDNNEYLGWHIDPKEEGLWEFPIVSLSFGADREFQIRKYTIVDGKRKGEGDVYSVVLESGSMLTMPPNFQAEYEHRLNKTSKKCGQRINLTFRKM